MSARADVIRQRAPKAYVALSQADAQRLGVKDRARITLGGASVDLPVRLSDSLPAGAVGLPVGLKGVPFAAPGSAVTVGAI